MAPRRPTLLTEQDLLQRATRSCDLASRDDAWHERAGADAPQLWRGALLLCDYLVSYPEICRGASALELGAGIGLVSLVAHRVGARPVWATGMVLGRRASICAAASGCPAHRRRDFVSLAGARERPRSPVSDAFDSVLANAARNLVVKEGEDVRVRRLNWSDESPFRLAPSEPWAWTSADVAALGATDRRTVLLAADGASARAVTASRGWVLTCRTVDVACSRASESSGVRRCPHDGVPRHGGAPAGVAAQRPCPAGRDGAPVRAVPLADDRPSGASTDWSKGGGWWGRGATT